ncbi:hypothetical protein BC826DRAFT_73728 [Russula brevipes]|nr:hypothetical protein BC826DRAFT_73728 [Russula brevipes]
MLGIAHHIHGFGLLARIPFICPKPNSPPMKDIKDTLLLLTHHYFLVSAHHHVYPSSASRLTLTSPCGCQSWPRPRVGTHINFYRVPYHPHHQLVVRPYSLASLIFLVSCGL